MAYLQERFEQLDEDSQRRMTTNPLRILDSKVESTQALLVGAPTLHDYLDEESIAHFEGLKARLDAVGLRYEINQKLVRGLDYYCRTAFEWVTDKLGAQGTVCGGGRYDGWSASSAASRPRVSVSPWAWNAWCCCWKPWG